MQWQVIESGKKTADENMRLDELLLSRIGEEQRAILHFYDWQEDSITYGHFIQPDEYLNMEGIKRRQVRLAKRPTGGGIVFHTCDFAFSVIVPSHHSAFSLNPLENYAFVNGKVKSVIEQLLYQRLDLLQEEDAPLDEACDSFCMAKATKYDVMIRGKKVGGAAQRKTKQGYLHQGSIFIGCLPDDYLEEILKEETRVIEGMKKNSFPILQGCWVKDDLERVRKQLKVLLKGAFI